MRLGEHFMCASTVGQRGGTTSQGSPMGKVNRAYSSIASSSSVAFQRRLLS